MAREIKKRDHAFVQFMVTVAIMKLEFALNIILINISYVVLYTIQLGDYCYDFCTKDYNPCFLLLKEIMVNLFASTT